MSTEPLHGGSLFAGGSFGYGYAFSGVSVTSSDHRAARCLACRSAVSGFCGVRFAAFAARFPETAALLAVVPATLHRALARDFFTVHLSYFVAATLAGAAIVAPAARVPYVDGWLICSGAMTGASLSTFDVSRLTRGAEVVVWILMGCGGVLTTALGPLLYRMFVFRVRLKPALRKARRLGRDLRRAARPKLPAVVVEEAAEEAGASEDAAAAPPPPNARAEAPHALGTPESAAAVLAALDAADGDELLAELSAQDEGLAAVATIVAAYLVFWTLVVMGVLWRRARLAAPGSPLAAALAHRGLSHGWYALFFSTSSLMNVGLSLFPSSAAPMSADAPSLLAICAAILAGNTAWPLALRALLRLSARSGRRGLGRLSLPHAGSRLGGGGGRRSSVADGVIDAYARFARGADYALQHPQRCYHLLFPARETWALAAAVAATNAVQLAAFGASSATLPAVVAAAPRGADRAALALFTTVNSRSAGFTAVDLNELAPVVVVLFAFMMWFSPYPLVALWARDDDDGGGDLFAADATEGRKSRHGAPIRWPALRAFTRRYLRKHLAWLTLALIAITAAEGPLLRAPSVDGSGRSPTSIFAILFEILSAYGTNGASLGWPGAPFNLCGLFTPFSKLVLIALMFLGRHRSMPRKVDPALASRVAAAERLAAAVAAELAARGAESTRQGSGSAPSLATRVGSFTADSVAAALALIRSASDDTLSALAAGTRQQSAAAVAAALAQQRDAARRGDALRRWWRGDAQPSAPAAAAERPQAQQAQQAGAGVGVEEAREWGPRDDALARGGV